MATSAQSPVERILSAWRSLSPRPGGRWMFSRLFGLAVPYTGSIRPQVEEIRPGYARVRIRDRRAVRNHLNSVHAIALANLGEAASGLATLAGMPATVQGILVGIAVEYVKKARGTLVAECTATPPAVTAPVEYVAEAFIRDAAGDTVAIVRATWRLRPVPTD